MSLYVMYSCMMEEIRIPIHKQIVQRNIYRIHVEEHKMKSIVTNNENIYFIVCVRIFNRGKET